jgi:predicted amidohydrolase
VTADCADLFCELFDGLAPAEFRIGGAEAWLGDGRVRDLAQEIEADAVDGSLSAEAVRASVEQDPGGEGTVARFAALLGLDAALAHANPLLSGVAPPALAEPALRYAEGGRLDSGVLPGALLPRFARPGRGGQLPGDLSEAFASVIRVGPTEWDACEHYVLPAHARLARPQRDSGSFVATAPLIREPDELHWEAEERGGMRFYRIHPADREPTRRRIERVIRAWDEQGAAIGVAPELCLSQELLSTWQGALRGRERPSSSELRLVLAGSGNVDGHRPPANTAVLLDAVTGEVLMRQSKIHPFNFTPEDVELWGLADRFSAPIDEDLRPGERLGVVEAGGTRIAILVCEDLSRLHAFSAVLHAHGVSLILVPVFARPTKDRRWERARAEVYGDATGSSVVVANSLVMAAILDSPTPVGTALAVAGGQAAVGHAADADDVVVFALDGDGPRVAHERPINP